MNICALSGLILALRGPLPAASLSAQSHQMQPDQPVFHLRVPSDCPTLHFHMRQHVLSFCVVWDFLGLFPYLGLLYFTVIPCKFP